MLIHGILGILGSKSSDSALEGSHQSLVLHEQEVIGRASLSGVFAYPCNLGFILADMSDLYFLEHAHFIFN